jgi:hypothetical protein
MNHYLIKGFFVIITISLGSLNTRGQVYLDVGVPQLNYRNPLTLEGHGLFVKGGYKWRKIIATATYYQAPSIDFELGGGLDLAYVMPLNKIKSWNLYTGFGYMYLFRERKSVHLNRVSNIFLLNMSVSYHIKYRVHLSSSFSYGFAYLRYLNPTRKIAGPHTTFPYILSLAVGYDFIKNESR